MKTVRAIAREAGVSPATVSRILNGSAGVSREKREKVSAILKLSGESIPARRSGKKRLTRGMIGVILLPGSEHDPGVILQKLSVISAKLPRGWDLILLSPQIPPQELTARNLRGDLSGLLLIGHDAESTGIHEVLDKIPHVWLNSYKSRDGAQSILMGNEFAGRIAARYLLRKNCQNTVCLSISSVNPGFSARLDGFRFEYFARAAKSGCTVLKLQLSGGETLECCSDTILEQALEDKKIIQKLLKADGIFSPEDRLTAFLHRVLHKAGIKKFPEIVSCNRNPEYLAGLYPCPASIDLGAATGAELGIDELFRRISGEDSRSDDVAVIAAPKLIPSEDPLSIV